MTTSEFIRVAILGAGHWGPNLIRAFHDNRASKVLWVVDRDELRLREVGRRYPGIRLSQRPEDAITDEHVDAVVIATPTTTHFELARSSLRAGKHVLVEKPIATSTAEANELCALAEAANLILMAGHVFLFNPGIRRLGGELQAGRIGKILYISTVRTNLGPIRHDVNAAWDLAAHDIAIVDWWLGCGPDFVSAHGASFINVGLEDVVFATLWYPAGVVVHAHVSWLSPRKVREITVVGELGMMTFDDMNISEPVRFYDKGVAEGVPPAYADTFGSFRTSVREGDIVVPKVAGDEPLRAECAQFVEAVRAGVLPIADGRSGAQAVRTLEAIDRSLRAGGTREPV